MGIEGFDVGSQVTRELRAGPANAFHHTTRQLVGAVVAVVCAVAAPAEGGARFVGSERLVEGPAHQVQVDQGDIEFTRDLEKLQLGWVVSVHKAQGSAFRHVVVPVTPSRLLDRSWIYTAVTRAAERLFLLNFNQKLLADAAEPT